MFVILKYRYLSLKNEGLSEFSLLLKTQCQGKVSIYMNPNRPFFYQQHPIQIPQVLWKLFTKQVELLVNLIRRSEVLYNSYRIRLQGIGEFSNVDKSCQLRRNDKKIELKYNFQSKVLLLFQIICRKVNICCCELFLYAALQDYVIISLQEQTEVL